MNSELRKPGHPMLAAMLTVSIHSFVQAEAPPERHDQAPPAMSAELELLKEEETVSIASRYEQRSGRLLQILESSVEEFFGMRNHASSIVVSQRAGHSVVADDSLIKGVQQPAVKLLVDETGFHEVLAEGPMNRAVLVEAQPFAQKQGLCSIEHRVIGTTDCEVRIAFAQQGCGCRNGAPSFVEQRLRLFVHAGIATSRTLTRKAVFPFAQSCSGTNTRLMVRP